jgi:hypothetical protein
MKHKIKEVTITTAQGVRQYSLGDSVNGMILSKIEEKPLYIDGDPFTFYVGSTEADEMIFKVSALAPLCIEYI